MIALAALVALGAGLAIIGALDHAARTVPAPASGAGFFAAAAAGIDRLNRGNAAFVLLEGGRVHGMHFASVGARVGPESLFQVASLSKWIAAWGVMTLVEQGRLELDAPVSAYLTRWRLPASEFDHDAVTVRRLLSHTAGLTDRLGYLGFPPGAQTQSLEASLTRAADAMPGADGRVRVGYTPGKDWRYSGGGYTLLQLLVEETSGEPFDVYMRRAVLEPLGMRDSTFVLDEKAARMLVQSHDADGAPSVHHRFTALAAASLYTSAADLARFLQAQHAGLGGEPPGRGVLAPATLEQMWQPQAWRSGRAIWGLGTALYARNAAGGFVVGHDGGNAPAIEATARIDPATGHGVIVLATGNPGLATALAEEWMLYATSAAANARPR